MSEDGKIASRIFSKHLVIRDEFDTDEENQNDESNIKLSLTSPSEVLVEDISQSEKDNKAKETTDDVINRQEEKSDLDMSQDSDAKNEIPEIGDLSEEFTHAAALGDNSEELMIEGINDFFEGDDKMLGENNVIDINEATENEDTYTELRDLNFDDDEGETLVLNFQIPTAPLEVSNEIFDKLKTSEELDDIFTGSEYIQSSTEPMLEQQQNFKIEIQKKPEFKDTQVEELPQEISFFDDTKEERAKQLSTFESINFEIPQIMQNQETEMLEIAEFQGIEEESAEQLNAFETQQSEIESLEMPKFEFIDDGDEEQEEPINEDLIIDDSQGRVIEENANEEPLDEEVEDYGMDLIEEESEIDGITVEFPELQDISTEIKSFLLNNIDVLTKDRVAICLNLDLSLEELKGFFAESLGEAHREMIYNKLRKVEMQYIFENFIQCFSIERFTRKKKSIDGNIVRNIVVLKEDILIDGYESLNTAHDIDVKAGENAFILSDELEINIKNYLDEIKVSKLNAENVYLMILDGAIVDDDAVKMATRYGIKIVDMDISISTVNKNLEEIKKRIIV